MEEPPPDATPDAAPDPATAFDPRPLSAQWPLWGALVLAVVADLWTVAHLRAGGEVIETGLRVPLVGPSVLAALALLLLAYHARGEWPRAVALAAAAYLGLGVATLLLMAALAGLGVAEGDAYWFLAYPPAGWLAVVLNWPVVLTAALLCPLGVVPCA